MQSQMTPNLTPSYLATLVQLNLEFLEQLPPVQVKNQRVAAHGGAMPYAGRTIPKVKREKHIDLPNWLKGDQLTDFLESLRPGIRRQAYNLSQRVWSVALDPQDLEQEAMLAAWHAASRYDETKVKSEKSFIGYCMKFARFAMIKYVQQQTQIPTISLEDYLEVETHNGTWCRELPAPSIYC
jgi:hypothetical protein